MTSDVVRELGKRELMEAIQMEEVPKVSSGEVTQRDLPTPSTDVPVVGYLYNGYMDDVPDDSADSVAAAEVARLSAENSRLTQDVEELRRTVAEMTQLNNNNNDRSNDVTMTTSCDVIHGDGVIKTAHCSTCRSLKLELIRTKMELKKASESSQAAFVQMRRLKAEKLSLLGRIKQLLDAVDEKEAKLQRFLLTFQRHICDTSRVIAQMTSEREEWENCKWKVTKIAQSASDRVIELHVELDEKEQKISQLEQQLKLARSIASTTSSTMKSEGSEGSRSRSISTDDVIRTSTTTNTNSIADTCSSVRDSVVEVCDEAASNKAQTLAELHLLPISDWNAGQVMIWMELEMGMTAYLPTCVKSIKTGKDLLDNSVASVLGIDIPLHRRKLQLAIDELQNPTSVRFPKAGALSHKWVSGHWLNGLGLRQYDTAFDSQLIDGRVLNSLTKKDLEKHLNITRKVHQNSILFGVQLLRLLGFDKDELLDRQDRGELEDNDFIVWTSQQITEWLHRINLEEYAMNMRESGINGALLVLDHSFSADMFATLLGVPLTKTTVRRHLATELEPFVMQARSMLESQKPASKRHAFVRSFVSSLSSKNNDIQNGSRSSAKTFSSFRGSLGRAFSRKATKDSVDPRRASLAVVPVTMSPGGTSTDLPSPATGLPHSVSDSSHLLNSARLLR